MEKTLFACPWCGKLISMQKPSPKSPAKYRHIRIRKYILELTK